MKTFIVRCVAGGSVIGGCLEDCFGNPLTKKTANALAKYENERSARRREQKLPGAWDYYVDSFEQPDKPNENQNQLRRQPSQEPALS